jgi:hypothetical protein
LKKILFIIGLLGGLFITSVCMAENVSVGTSGTPGNIELIRIYVDPYGCPLEKTETVLSERDAIDRLTSEKIYFSEEERIMDQLRQNYDIEEIHKDEKDFWKCTPKNPKTIQVRKSREIVNKKPGVVEHITEYYEEEIPNPNYLEPEELEKKIIWYQVKRVEKDQKKDDTQDLDGTRSIRDLFWPLK